MQPQWRPRPLSIGVVNVAVAPNTTILDIANYADKVVYYAKTAGKNAIYTSIRGDTAEDSSTTFFKIDF